MNNVINLADYRSERPALEQSFVLADDPRAYSRGSRPLDRVELFADIGADLAIKIFPIAQAAWSASAKDGAVHYLRPTTAEENRAATRWPALSLEQAHPTDGLWHLNVVLTRRRTAALITALLDAGALDRTDDEAATA